MSLYRSSSFCLLPAHPRQQAAASLSGSKLPHSSYAERVDHASTLCLRKIERMPRRAAVLTKQKK